ncbi:hypothetical protein HK097_003075 [Rhizophlyctis rosea]|uniref:Uncharacterized protein n=1 Tax=Rhizophlyctis rosea TaxID=64517 RepID=A0AAD5SG38_9FUNG|nr:hypothetical protein HK097_003075 [Rhizophlyctis rosea]
MSLSSKPNISKPAQNPSSKSSEKGALNSVVSSLTRAALGNSATDVQDDDIDRYVAELIASEAAAANSRYDTFGVSAFLGRSKNLPKPNKRFLTNVIKSTDAHNEALLRKEREEAEDRLRDMARERRKGLNPSSRDSRRRKRDWREEISDEEERDDGRSGRRRRRRSHDKNSESDDEERRKSKRGRKSKDTDASKSPEKKRTTSPSSKHHHTQPDTNPSVESWGTHSCMRLPISSPHLNPPESNPRPTKSSPRKTKGRGSTGSTRLDKYFSEGYDPRLDLDNYDDNSLEHYVNTLEELQAGVVEGRGRKEKRVKKEKKKKRKRKRSRTRSRSLEGSEGSGEEKRARKMKRRDRSWSRSSTRSDSRGRRRTRSRSRERSRTRTRSSSFGPTPPPDPAKVIGGPRSELPVSCPW